MLTREPRFAFTGTRGFDALRPWPHRLGVPMPVPELTFGRSESGNRPKYQVLMELGSGGMAVVHLAMSRGPQGFVKLFVLKTLKPELLADGGSRRMFMEEARISARLAHPNIVQVYEVLEQNGLPTMVMEYLEGQPLSTILSRPAGMPLPLRLHVIAQLLAGLHAAHELRDYDGTPLELVHRDVSPHNVFVLYDGQVKVLDFGIAKAADSKVDTQTGVLKGKIRYMAPEQLAGQPQDRRADLFAVGIMLWEALAGRRLWQGMQEADVMLQLLTQTTPELPADVNIPDGLRKLCRHALSGHRDGRPATAAEMLAALERCIESENLRCTPQELGAYVSAEFEEARRAANQVVDSAIKQAELGSERPTSPVRGPQDAIPTRAPPKPEQSSSRPMSRPKSERPVRRSLGFVVGVALAGALVWAAATASSRAPVPSAQRAPAPSAAVPALVCGAGTKECGGRCVSTDSPETGCAASSCQPCSLPNATPRCNATGACDVAVCYRNFDDCDGNRDNGCESNLKTMPSSCGACGRECPPLPHAQTGCGDACTIWRCEKGYRDCNEVVDDGCEVAVSSDAKNCGHCGVSCGRGKRCVEGECR